MSYREFWSAVYKTALCKLNGDNQSLFSGMAIHFQKFDNRYFTQEDRLNFAVDCLDENHHRGIGNQYPIIILADLVEELMEELSAKQSKEASKTCLNGFEYMVSLTSGLMTHEKASSIREFIDECEEDYEIVRAMIDILLDDLVYLSDDDPKKNEYYRF